MSKLDLVKRVAVWAGPAVAGLALYAALASQVTVPVAALVVAAGVAVSWAGRMVWDRFVRPHL